MTEKYVWVFNGSGSRFPSGVFQKKEDAFDWINRNRLSGVLTRYPLDISVYDWAVDKNFFKPVSEKQKSPDFVKGFSSASQEHYHFENGKTE